MLNCHIHDYVEIACMYRIAVRLTMKSGELEEGVAYDVVRNIEKQECLLLKQGDHDNNIILEEVQSMQALTNNSHFSLVEFR